MEMRVRPLTDGGDAAGIRAFSQRSAVLAAAARDRQLAKRDRHPKGVRALRVAALLTKASDKRTRLPAEGRTVWDSLRASKLGWESGRLCVVGPDSLRGAFAEFNSGHGRRKGRLAGLRWGDNLHRGHCWH